MKRICIGIIAHVDAGKTTLSEGLLYRAGALRQLGRVDHRDAFLDTHELERSRGITIFSKEARLTLPHCQVTLLDTPGHVDFSAEMERTLQVLDCAVLVISGTDGVQSHTETAWRLLARYRIPTFLFVNKMDLPGPGQAALLAELHRRLAGEIVDFSQPAPARDEAAALCGEGLMEAFLAKGALGDGALAAAIADRTLFPCWFGSALRLEGVDALLDGIDRLAPSPHWGERFAARVFKLAQDRQGNTLAHLKITGGALHVRDALSGPGWSEKVTQIRLYSGAKFQTAESAPAGTVCAVTGLTHVRPGDGLGAQAPAPQPTLEPVLTYRALPPAGMDDAAALALLRTLEGEDPQLHVVWQPHLRQIHLQLMGEIQLEILQQLIARRFGVDMTFDQGDILYKETIAAPIEGVGHFEPLRHYAEVHLLLEPGERGSGLTLCSACPEDSLDGNWQRLILSHLAEKVHVGVLTGSPITDMTVTLLAGRAHEKHTEGGDFRQATYRALRQGLMSAQSVLLEPWYEFRLEVPAANVGRAMTDLQRMGADFAPPETAGETALLTGRAPVAALRGYQREVLAYTHGAGRLSCLPGGYAPCHDSEAVIARMGYDPDRDEENPSCSVFCDHGAGHTVPWQDVRAHMHIDTGWGKPRAEEQQAFRRRRAEAYCARLAEDKELREIFERTYGPIRRSAPAALTTQRSAPRAAKPQKAAPVPLGPDYLLVDGYNIIFAWEDLRALARESLDAARAKLIDILCNYQGFRQCELILVFDAYKVKGNPGTVQRVHNITVVYTKEAETADMYIEKATHRLGKDRRIRVATSDGLEQVIILGHGALRLSASAFREEVDQALSMMRAMLL